MKESTPRNQHKCVINLPVYSISSGINIYTGVHIHKAHMSLLSLCTDTFFCPSCLVSRIQWTQGGDAWNLGYLNLAMVSKLTVIPEIHLMRKGGINVDEKTWAFLEN